MWSTVIPSEKAVRKRRSRDLSSSASSSQRVHASSKAISLSIASIVSNAGGRPASSGRSRNSAPAKLCSVWMKALSRDCTPCAQRRRHSSGWDASAAASSRSERMRTRSSAAAASVKVMAAILSSVVSSLATRLTMRPTRLVVLPVPAPASTNRVSRSALAILSRAGWSCAV